MSEFTNKFVAHPLLPARAGWGLLCIVYKVEIFQLSKLLHGRHFLAMRSIERLHITSQSQAATLIMRYSRDMVCYRQNMTFTNRLLLLLIAVLSLFNPGSVCPAEEQAKGELDLRETYLRIEPDLQRNTFGIPLYLESSERKNRVSVDVYGIIDHPFSNIQALLNIPANWCDIVSLPPNIKACTYMKSEGQWKLTFYSGRQFEQSPEEADQVVYSFRTIEDRQGYLNVSLGADEGPLGTRDHRISFEAVPVDGERTFVHFRYALRHGALFRIAGSLYFDTFGRDKIGFTVTGTDRHGEPVYVGGARGGIERNAVRYYFAIESYMDTIKYPAENRFREKVSRWYDLTTRYRQLEEMDKRDYLKMKERERRVQEMLQKTVLTGPD